MFLIWWSRQDSNLRPPPCKGGTLPTELQDREECITIVFELGKRDKSYESKN